MHGELVFLVERSPDGGYTARALGESIFSEAETVDALHDKVRDAVLCHFDEHARPVSIRLQFAHA